MATIYSYIHQYNRDEEKNTIYVYKRHLKISDKKILKEGGDAIYNLSYESLLMRVKNAINKYKNEGYKVVFEHNEKKVLLLFNK